jgi:hypothetical protein
MNKFIPYKSLKDYTNEELISYLNNNEMVDLSMMAGILSEILKRMNKNKMLLEVKKDNDYLET